MADPKKMSDFMMRIIDAISVIFKTKASDFVHLEHEKYAKYIDDLKMSKKNSELLLQKLEGVISDK